MATRRMSHLFLVGMVLVLVSARIQVMNNGIYLLGFIFESFDLLVNPVNF